MLIILSLGLFHSSTKNSFLVKANTPPSCQFIFPSGGETLTGLQEIKWLASDADNDNLTFSLLYASISSLVWTSLVIDYSMTSYFWDTSTVSDDTYFLKLIVSDGLTESAIQTPVPIKIVNNLPYDDGLILTGIPYPIINLNIGENLSFYIELTEQNNYSIYLYGGYLGKNVDLNVYLIPNESVITRTLLENSPRSLTHRPGISDIFSVLPDQTGIYRVFIENDVRYSTSSAEAKLLILEKFSDFSDNLRTFSDKAFDLNATGLQISSKTDFKAYLFTPDIINDKNFTFTLNPSSSLQAELRLYPLFTIDNLMSYLPLDQSQTTSLLSRGTSEGQILYLSQLISEQISSISFFGIIIFVRALTGSGDIILSVSQEDFYSIETITPPSIPIWFTLSSGDIKEFSMLLNAHKAYSIFLDLPIDSKEGWNLFLYDQTSVTELASTATFSKNGTSLYIDNTVIITTGRYFIKVSRDNSTSGNITSSEIAQLFVSEHFTETSLPASFDIYRGELNSSPSLKTYSSLFIPVQKYNGKNLKITLTPTPDLRITSSIISFTTVLDRIGQNRTLDSKTALKKGEEIFLEHKVGFRGYEHTKDEFWLLKLEGIRGNGTVTISIETSTSSDDWLRIVLLTGVIGISILSLILVIAFEKRF
jgi:hypothetical protein